MSLLWWLSAARAEIVVEVPPYQGIETVILVTDEAGESASGETVRVIHRPGLGGERELAIGITDGRGRVRWKPEQGGVALLRADEQTLRVQITPSALPVATLVLLALLAAAGLLSLAGGLLGRPGAAARARVS